MKIIVRTYGGIAPAVRPPARELDASRLAPAEGRQLARLVESLPAADAPTPAHPDEQRYEVTIETATGERVVKCGDATMTDSFALLLEFIEQHGHRC